MFRRSIVVVITIVGMSSDLTAQYDAVLQARQLYCSTYYEEALDVLNHAVLTTATPGDRQRVREYRALALFALNRLSEAETVIEEMIQADPFYRPSESTLPPGIVLRPRPRPHAPDSVAREEYERARSHFNEKRYAAATTGFERQVCARIRSGLS